MVFTENEIRVISDVLNKTPKVSDASYLWSLVNPRTGQALNLTIHSNVEFKDKKIDAIISVQTQHGYFELHNCTAFLTFEPDEVIFVNTESDKLSCLIVSRECNCSMFSNIERDLLNFDFSKLDTRLLLSAMQLSIIESII